MMCVDVSHCILATKVKKKKKWEDEMMEMLVSCFLHLLVCQGKMRKLGLH